jgi:eukaryotic-like serine/threonine-protein kinase
MSSAGLPVPGDVIAGKYEIERVLGSGGMGIVLAARHKQLGQRVAIKLLHGEAAADSSAATRFLREARSAVALASEHVTRVLDVGELENGAPFMVMEYLAGVDLAEVLDKSGPLEIPYAVGAVLQACEAIAEAHSIGIVHRDLKPANLFVTQRVGGTPLIKVLDFGISKMTGTDSLSAGQSLTASGSLMGSPCYMSPEQVRSAKTVDPRSDIWALGVILYELLTAVRPFLGDTLGETFAKILSEPHTPIREVRPEVPEGLATIIGLCLERRLDRRLQSVAALATSLAPFAPADAIPLVERISRISKSATRAVASRASSDTMTVPPTAVPTPGSGSTEAQHVETSPAWLTSGAKRPASSSRGMLIGLAVAALGAVAVGAIGWRALRVTSVAEAKASHSVASSSPGARPMETPQPAPSPEPAALAESANMAGEPSAVADAGPFRAATEASSSRHPPTLGSARPAISSALGPKRAVAPVPATPPGNKSSYENF